MRVAAESPGVDYVAQGCRIPTSSMTRRSAIRACRGPRLPFLGSSQLQLSGFTYHANCTPSAPSASYPLYIYHTQWCRIPTSWSSSRFMRVAGPKKGPDCLFGVVPGRRYNYQALQLSYSRHNETATTSNTPTATLRYPAPASELCTQRTDLSHAGENHLGRHARIFDVRRHPHHTHYLRVCEALWTPAWTRPNSYM